MDSLPILTDLLHLDWHSSQKGLFLGLLSLAMVPVNLAVGAASAHLSGRSMVFGSLAACVAALAALALGAANAVAFFGGGTLLFTASVVLEGTSTSLMSKVIWKGFAMGVFNAGGWRPRARSEPACHKPTACRGWVPGLAATPPLAPGPSCVAAPGLLPCSHACRPVEHRGGNAGQICGECASVGHRQGDRAGRGAAATLCRRAVRLPGRHVRRVAGAPRLQLPQA